ncbi:MAG: hypothetical protein R3C11_00630 [Planctomycetaceae bacterium]
MTSQILACNMGDLGYLIFGAPLAVLGVGLLAGLVCMVVAKID